MTEQVKTLREVFDSMRAGLTTAERCLQPRPRPKLAPPESEGYPVAPDHLHSVEREIRHCGARLVVLPHAYWHEAFDRLLGAWDDTPEYEDMWVDAQMDSSRLLPTHLVVVASARQVKVLSLPVVWHYGTAPPLAPCPYSNKTLRKLARVAAQMKADVMVSAFTWASMCDKLGCPFADTLGGRRVLASRFLPPALVILSNGRELRIVHLGRLQDEEAT